MGLVDWELIGCDHVASSFVASLEILVELFTNSGILALKKQLGNVEHLLFERILEVEFFAGNQLYFKVLSVARSNREELTLPGHLVA